MLRRGLWWLAGLAALFAVVVWFDRSTDPVNPATHSRIEVGQTLNSVEAAIGRPADYSDLPTFLDYDGSGIVKLGVRRAWNGSCYRIVVCFDPNGRVMVSSVGKVFIPNPNIPDRIRAWLAGWE